MSRERSVSCGQGGCVDSRGTKQIPFQSWRQDGIAFVGAETRRTNEAGSLLVNAVTRETAT